MKRAHVTFLAACVLCAAFLAGCGGQTAGPGQASSAPPQSAAASVSEPAPSAAEDAAAEDAAAESAAAGDAPDTALSGALQEENLAPAGETSPDAGPASAAAQTAYGSGRWYVYAEREGSSFPDTQELQFQDGKLVLHFYSLNDYGKGGYGEGCSDELQFSPYAQNTLEEAMTQLESEGYTVTVQQ